MRFKGTAVLFVAFVALGAWVYLTDVRGREEREQAAADAEKVMPVEAEEISEIGIVYPDRAIRARRVGEAWEFVEPEGLEADSGEWDLLASNVGRIERDETLTEGAADLAEYGLDAPNLTLSVTTADGRSEEIHFGAENPRKIHHYAKLASSDEVFLSPASWLRIFRKEVDELRDKTVLRFDADSIERIEIEGERTLALAREGDTWRLEQPIAASADDTEVSTFLGAIEFARASSFADGIEADAAGLERPAFRVRLRAGEDERVLAIGSPTGEEARYYARDASRPTVFVIDDDVVVERLRRPVFDWRDKRLPSFDRDDVLTITLDRSGDRLDLRRCGEDWVLPDGRKAEWSRISGMLNALEFERASDIMDAPGALSRYGLDDPRLRVELGGDGGPVLAFAFGADAEGDDGVYWKAEGEGRVFEVSLDVYDRFDVTAADLVAAESESGSEP